MTDESKAEEQKAEGKKSKVKVTGYRVTVDVIFPIGEPKRGAAAEAEGAAWDFCDKMLEGQNIPAGAKLVAQPVPTFGGANIAE